MILREYPKWVLLYADELYAESNVDCNAGIAVACTFFHPSGRPGAPSWISAAERHSRIVFSDWMNNNIIIIEACVLLHLTFEQFKPLEPFEPLIEPFQRFERVMSTSL